MNAKEMFYLMEDVYINAGIWICGECKCLFREKAVADSCCLCTRCGKQRENGYIFCEECNIKHREDVEKTKFEKAEKIGIEDWDGPVWTDFASNGNDGYFGDLGELLEFAEDEGIEIPYAYTCGKDPFNLDLERALENSLEEMWDEAEEHLVGYDELKTAVDKFNKDNSHIEGWFPNCHKIVILNFKPERKDD